MVKHDVTTIATLLQNLLTTWYDSVANPIQAQEKVLHRLLRDYAQTEYGRQQGATVIDNIEDYRRAFPAKSYEDYKPLIERVKVGDISLLLAEEPVGWAITRGTMQDQPKFIPMTPTDLRQRISAGRAMMNYVLREDRYELFEGVNLNLNFPSVVGIIKAGEREIEYGYSSGIYAKHVSSFTPIRSVPSQQQLDELGGSRKISAWNRRFELAFNLCRSLNVSLVGGVCQTSIQFARYLKKEHKHYPNDIWNTQVMTLGSTPGINTRYRSTLRALYGPVVIREIYGATEGIFGQQRDNHRAWVPNYDQFFFEVETRSGIKMLHEMRPLEIGRLIVSTPTLPRYVIGDVILAFKRPYFRCIGRDRRWTVLNYIWSETTSFNFNQL